MAEREPRVRVDLMNVSLDGFAAGTHITFEEPMGGARELFRGFDGRTIAGVHRADTPITAAGMFNSVWGQGVGAEIMGRGKFGPQQGPWENDGWRGWWDDDPPFRTPVVVLSHHAREPIEFANGTIFEFFDGSPAEALARARSLAGDLDVRIGGGPSTVRQFLADDLVDFLHLSVQPIVLGRGAPLWSGLDGVHNRFDIESVALAGGVVHQFWNRTQQS